MTVFQYSSRHSSGVPVYGVAEAQDTEALRDLLSLRGLQLQSATALDMHASLTQRPAAFPRLLQLRVGERLREAVLSDLPAHVAVRAVAEEPLEHPALILHAWSQVIFCFLTCSLGLASIVYRPLLSFCAVSAVITAAWALIRIPLHGLLITGPRRLLLDVAQRLESGESAAESLQGLLLPGVEHLMTGPLSAEARARSLAELLSGTASSSLQRMRVAMQSTGPLLLGGLALTLVLAYLGYTAPRISEILMGFGVTIPWITGVLLSLGRWIHGPGRAAVTISLVTYFCLLSGLWVVIASGRMPGFLLRVPLLGASLKWLSQGRFCQLLSVLLRNQAGPVQALRIAGTGSGRRDLAAAGDRLAQSIESDGPAAELQREFDGLPMALLQSHQQTSDREQQDRIAAEVFAGLGQALENAATGHGAMFVLIAELLVVCFTAAVVLISYVAFFMPLFKLLTNLSVIVLPVCFSAGGLWP